MTDRFASFPPYQLVDPSFIASAQEKTRRLERLYHLTQQHSWDGPKVLQSLIDEHGLPGADIAPETKAALSRVLSVLMWGELAAWNISADLALEIEDVDAKMAATAQVFDEARHFYVMRDYVLALGEPQKLGGLPTRLLRKVLNADTLAKKLVGMQLLFETNAVVIFKRLGEKNFCPVLSGIMPYFERDESRHVGLGVMYIPRLVERMTKAEARATARFQSECLLLLMASGFAVKDDFEQLQLNRRLMAERVTRMQDEVVEQIFEQGKHSRLALAINRPNNGIRPVIFNFIHPEEGMEARPLWQQRVHEGMVQTAKLIDRTLPN